MRRIRVLVFSLLLVGLVLSVAGTPQASAGGLGITTELLPGQALIHGKLMKDDRRPSNGDALVEAYAWEAQPGDEPVATSFTYGGGFELYVPAGAYRIKFTDLSEYGLTSPSFHYGGADGAQVTAGDGERIDLGQQAFDLPRGSGTATVTVVGEDSSPIEDADLSVYLIERYDDGEGNLVFGFESLLDLPVSNRGGGEYGVDLSALYQGNEYTIRAGARGHAFRFLGGGLTPEEASIFSVDDETPTLETITLPSKPGISGLVTGPDGEPAPGTRVQLHRFEGESTDRQGRVRQEWWETDDVARTGPDGSYWLPQPEPGRYTLQFQRDSDFRGDVASEQVYLGGVHTVWVPGVFPEPFDVSAEDVDITKDMAFSGVPASGVVLDQSGRPLSGVDVYSRVMEGGKWTTFGSALDTTDSSGRYDLYLPRGREVKVVYRLWQTYKGTVRLHTFDPAGTGDIALDDVSLEPRFSAVLGTHAGERHEYCLQNTLAEEGDDTSGEAVELPFDADFHGQPIDELFVNTNGNLSVGGPLSTYDPRDLSTAQTRPIIAPFWADATTNWPGLVSYGSSPDGQQFCATWQRVGHNSEGWRTKANTFQVILTSREDDPGRSEGDFNIRFNYDKIAWESGDSSGGVDGLGGRSAAVGYSAGTGDSGTWLELDGSRENGALLDTSPTGLIAGSRNSAQPGRYEIEVRNTTTLQDGEAEQAVNGGETVTTQGEATPSSPVQTSIDVPAGINGWLSVTPQPAEGSPTGFTLFGTELDISAPASTFDNPYVAGFTLDGSLLTAAGITVGDVQVFRNGAAVADCTHLLHAVPDPCVVSRELNGDGDAVITVRTSAFSTWSFGAVDYDLAGPFAPVDSYPTLNVAKAGATIPVKFRLGGDRGLDVLSDGFPQVRSVTCPDSPADVVEQTVAASSSKLVFDQATGTYSYLWKTHKGQSGCFELTLGFRDGDEVTAAFRLR